MCSSFNKSKNVMFDIFSPFLMLINLCVLRYTHLHFLFVRPTFSLYFELRVHVTVTGLHVFVCQVGAELCRGDAADQFCVETKISQSHPGAHGLLQIPFHRHSHRHLQKPRCSGSRYDIQCFFKSSSPQLTGFEAEMLPKPYTDICSTRGYAC